MSKAASMAAQHSAPLLSLSMYWPSQNTAPSGSEHCAVQPPVSSLVHWPWHSMSHSAFAWNSHLPSQDASHFALHSASGGSTLQLDLHSPPQLPSQRAWHSAWLASAEHWPWQVPEQSASQ